MVLLEGSGQSSFCLGGVSLVGLGLEDPPKGQTKA